MILISAGHHPTKPGACFEGFCEHDEAVRWVDEIYGHLGPDRAVKVPTGVLRDKVDFINARQPTVAIEVHFNAPPNMAFAGPKWSGALTLHYPGSDRGIAVATLVQDAIQPIFGKHWNGIMEGWYRMDKKHGPDFFLERTACPAVIVEPEFIHRRDVVTSGRPAACVAIANALLEAAEMLRGGRSGTDTGGRLR